MKDKAVFGGVASKKRTLDKGKAVKVAKSSKKEENKASSNMVGSSNSGGFQANVQTLGNYNYEHSSRPGERKVGRIDNSLTTLDKLKKIAQNSDKLDTMPCMQKVKDRRFVEEAKDPAKFNMMTFDREYGGIPQ